MLTRVIIGCGRIAFRLFTQKANCRAVTSGLWLLLATLSAAPAADLSSPKATSSTRATAFARSERVLSRLTLPETPRPAPVQTNEPAFSQATPCSIGDLRSIEQRVVQIVHSVSPAIVDIKVGTGSGSGVVISADGLVLTAGHVCDDPERDVRLTFPDGKTVRGHTLGISHDTDLGLVQIAEKGPWPHAPVGDLDQARVGDWVLALGHPGGFDLKRSLVARLGRMIQIDDDALQTDCTISPGDSGGPLLDMSGRVIGIHSYISPSLTGNFHVPVTGLYQYWNELVNASEQSAPEPATQANAGASDSSEALSRMRFRNGEQTLRAFAPLSDATRDSIVKFNVNGETVALGLVMDSQGLVLTKASEIKKGKLTCWLANETEVPANLLAVDDTEDLALVHVQATTLKPLPWADQAPAIGQWAITPGIAPTPQAVGIVSALPRRIRPPRSFIGVVFDLHAIAPRIGEIRHGFGAEKAGLKKGDVILGVNGSTVTNWAQVVDILGDFHDGQKIKVRVQREKTQFEADVLMRRPSPNEQERDPAFDRRRRRLSGETSRRAEDFEQALEHDTVLAPWLCGGPLVNLRGEALGLNIARASRVSTYALPGSLVREVFEKLKSAPAPAVN